MTDPGRVTVTVESGIGTVCFFHPKKNSLPGSLLRQLADEITTASQQEDIKVIVLKSEENGPFCAGASFDELTSIQNFNTGKEFFMGFAQVILAMRNSSKLIIVRVQGKVVGGGVGVVAAADYAFATTKSAIKLSELALGIGPFVVGPAVERKIGTSAFSICAMDADWHSAEWAKNNGLYADIFADFDSLDSAVAKLADKLSNSSPQAMAELKKVFWEKTDHWPELLEKRAEISGKLVLSDHTKNAIAAFKNR